MRRSPEYDAPPVKRSKSGGAGKAIGGFFRFLVFVGLIGAVAYNYYQVTQLRAELDALRNAPPSTTVALSTPRRLRASDHTSGEPDSATRRQKTGEAADAGSGDALAMLQKAREDAQATSNRTIADLQKRLKELSERVESMTPH